jgi:Ca2+-binding EF-hand superfamily protein
MKSIVMLAVGLAIAGTATLTFAETPPPGAAKPAGHAKVDTNGDGAIDRSEAAANLRMAQHFEKLDTNKDGRITADERPQRGMRDGKGGGQRGERMAQLDANKDGRFSREEMAGNQRVLQNFGAIDTNADGALTREEMLAYRKAHRGERGAGAQQK